MKKLLHLIYCRYEGFHLTISLAGNILFFIGSLFFALGITVVAKFCFITGSFGMLMGSLGELYVKKQDGKI